MKEQLGLGQINLYNMYKSASITCIANPKYSSGEAIQAMEELVQEQLGNNFGYEWTSVAYQETKAGSTTMLVFAMALLVAFLVLSAQYESWTSPIAAIMGLPIALLGTILGCFVMGVPVSIYTQIGIILLIALSAKNGILIVEFARDYHKAGNPIRESALEAGHSPSASDPDDFIRIRLRGDASAVCNRSRSEKPSILRSGSRIRHGGKHHFCNDVYPQLLRVDAVIPGKGIGQIQPETEISRDTGNTEHREMCRIHPLFPH